MALVISLMFFLLFCVCVHGHKNKRRKRLVFALCVFYMALILVSQVYLNSIGLSFQPSDPERYFNTAFYARSYASLMQDTIGDSNIYYYVMNRMFITTYGDKDLVAVAIQVTNLLMFLSAYLFATRKIKLHRVELLLLIHPYLALIIIRNVRDLHILSLSIIILSLTLAHKESIKKGIVYSGLFLARPFFTVIIFLSRFVERKKDKVSPRKVYLAVVALALAFGLVLFFSNSVYSSVIERVVSGYGFYNGYDGKYTQLKASWLTHDRSLSFIIEIFGIFLVSVIKFIFTPIIPNYLAKYLSAEGNGVFLDIYTDMDMLLIFSGALLNVVYFIPLFIRVTIRNIYSPRFIDACYLCAVWVVIIYSFAHLGGTDIRIRYSFILFFSFSLVLSGAVVNKTRTLVVGSVCALIALPAVILLLEVMN